MPIAPIWKITAPKKQSLPNVPTPIAAMEPFPKV
jgi:hypothetical protein